MSETIMTAKILENYRRLTQFPGGFSNVDVKTLLDHIDQLTARAEKAEARLTEIDAELVKVVTISDEPMSNAEYALRLSCARWQERARKAEAEIARRDIAWGNLKAHFSGPLTGDEFAKAIAERADGELRRHIKREGSDRG